MSPTLCGVDKKLERAISHVNNLDLQIRLFRDLKPYSVRVQEDTNNGKRVGRLFAVKNPAVGDPDVSLVLLAGEALYQFRSALDHLVHQLVLLHDPTFKIEDSRQHQFPIFDHADGPHGYGTKAGRMINGVPKAVAALIEGEQPYSRHPDSPHEDPLWILNSLNNADKHRLIPISVLGIGEIRGYDSKGTLFTLVSEDIVLEDNKVLWTFITPTGRYDDISAEIICAIAFEQAMKRHGVTVSMEHMLLDIAGHVGSIIERFRPSFSK